MGKYKKITNKSWFSTLIWVIGLILLWEFFAFLVAQTKRTPENILPHLYELVKAIFSPEPVSNSLSATATVLSSAWITLFRAFIGLALGTLMGILLAFAMQLFSFIEKTLFPYLMLIQLIPVLGLAPIILAITGDINVSRIVIAMILSFYPVTINTLAGLKSVDKDKYDLMYTYAAPKRVLYTKVIIPSSIPYFFTGLKIATPLAITASILVDTLQGDGGLGCILSQSLKHAMNIYVFWIIVAFAAFIGIISGTLINALENCISPEKRGRRKQKKEMKKAARISR